MSSKFNPKKTYLDKTKIEELYKRYEKGDTITNLALENNIHKSTLSRYFKRLEEGDLKSREIVWETRQKDVEAAYQKWHSLYSFRSLEAEYGISRGTLHRLFNEKFNGW